MAGEPIAFRRSSTGVPVSDVSRVIDLRRLGPLEQSYNNIVINSFGLNSVGYAIATAGQASGTATWPVANQAIYVPFCVQQPCIAVKMNIINVTPSGNVDVGIYSSAGALLVSKGTTANTGSTAIQTFDITDTTLPVGVYYFGLSFDNATATYRGVNAPAAVGFFSAMGILKQASAFPLPSTATFAAAAQAALPHIQLSARTLV